MDPGAKLSSSMSPQSPEERKVMENIPYLNAVTSLKFIFRIVSMGCVSSEIFKTLRLPSLIFPHGHMFARILLICKYLWEYCSV
jgi:hypothetical protein